MVDCTNENAREYLANHQVKRSSRFRKWEDTTLEEMKKFLGLRIWMGLDRKPRYDNYWSKNPLYKNSVASRVMTRDRFLLLLRFWHFGPNDPSKGKLYKIQPLVDKMQEKFEAAKTPGKFIVVDESMIGFRGRLGLRFVYNPREIFPSQHLLFLTY